MLDSYSSVQRQLKAWTGVHCCDCRYCDHSELINVSLNQCISTRPGDGMKPVAVSLGYRLTHLILPGVY